MFSSLIILHWTVCFDLFWGRLPLPNLISSVVDSSLCRVRTLWALLHPVLHVALWVWLMTVIGENLSVKSWSSGFYSLSVYLFGNAPWALGLGVLCGYICWDLIGCGVLQCSLLQSEGSLGGENTFLGNWGQMDTDCHYRNCRFNKLVVIDSYFASTA